MACEESVRTAVEHAMRAAAGGQLHVVLGTGRAAAAAWAALSAQCAARRVALHVYPTSAHSRALVLTTIAADRAPVLHALDELSVHRPSGSVVLVDGYDAACPAARLLVKGGGAAHFAEKLGALLADWRIFVGRPDKLHASVDALLSAVPVPVEVVPIAGEYVVRTVCTGIPGARADVRQSGPGKAGPVVTDNGNHVVDVFLPPAVPIADAERILKSIHGVISTGIFMLGDLPHAFIY